MIDTPRLVQTFEELVTEVEEARQRFGRFGYREPYARVLTRAGNLIQRVCGERSSHFQEYRRVADAAQNNLNLDSLKGILDACRRDLEGGLLLDLRSLVHAEVLGNFLEQARSLLGAGYHVPAASLAGAVLEDTLRKLCDKHEVSHPERTRLDQLNASLAKAGVYNTLEQKRITHLAGIRNEADHGNFEKVRGEDVADMVSFVERFAEEHLR